MNTHTKELKKLVFVVNVQFDSLDAFLLETVHNMSDTKLNSRRLLFLKLSMTSFYEQG